MDYERFRKGVRAVAVLWISLAELAVVALILGLVYELGGWWGVGGALAVATGAAYVAART